MNVYTTDRIRNVVLLGHGGCGKTSLVEAMAYLAGMTTRMGKVADGNTISDYDKEETLRDEHGQIVLNEDTAKRMRPDFILHYPNGNDIIIDSKVVLTAMYDYYAADDEAAL